MQPDNDAASTDDFLRLIELEMFLREWGEEFSSVAGDIGGDVAEAPPRDFSVEGFTLSVIELGAASQSSTPEFKQEVAKLLEELIPPIIDNVRFNGGSEEGAAQVYNEWLSFLGMEGHPHLERKKIILEHGKAMIEAASNTEGKFIALKYSIKHLAEMRHEAEKDKEEEKLQLRGFLLDDMIDIRSIICNFAAETQKGLRRDIEKKKEVKDGVTCITYVSGIEAAVNLYRAALCLLSENAKPGEARQFALHCYKNMWGLIAEAETGYDEYHVDMTEAVGRYAPDAVSLVNFIATTLEFLQPVTNKKQFESDVGKLVSPAIDLLHERSAEYEAPVTRGVFALLNVAVEALDADNELSKELMQKEGPDCLVYLIANMEFQAAASLMYNAKYILAHEAAAFSLSVPDGSGENKKLAVIANYKGADDANGKPIFFSAVTFSGIRDVYVGNEESPDFRKYQASNAKEIATITTLQDSAAALMSDKSLWVVNYGEAFKSHNYPSRPGRTKRQPDR